MRCGRRRGRAGGSRDVGDHGIVVDIELEPGDHYHHDLATNDHYRGAHNDDVRSVDDLTADHHHDLTADHHHCAPDVAATAPTPQHPNR